MIFVGHCSIYSCTTRIATDGHIFDETSFWRNGKVGRKINIVTFILVILVGLACKVVSATMVKFDLRACQPDDAAARVTRN